MRAWAICISPKRGYRPDEVKRVVIPEALADAGAAMLALPKRFIARFGLKTFYEKPARSSRSSGIVKVYEPVRLAVHGQTGNVDVIEVPDDVPALIGQVPLELMNWVVASQNQRLIGNPDHGGEQALELH